MAEVNTGGNEKGGKNKQKKVSLRVDFTPMVDMNMLLITFFMFCTTLSKPQTMEISMPDRDAKIETRTKVRPELAMTILVTAADKVFYYFGEPDYKDYQSVKESDYSPNGLRKVLLARNANIIARIDELKEKRNNDDISEDEFKKQAAEIKGAKDALVVIIKATDDSSYKNMIDVLDEMLICNVGKYAIVDYTKTDDFLLKNLMTKGNAAR
jgi:biopolymer transport protein ExbD